MKYARIGRVASNSENGEPCDGADAIRCVKHIALEVGDASGFVPYYLKKLYPVAVDACPVLQSAELRISVVFGRGLVIKEIGY